MDDVMPWAEYQRTSTHMTGQHAMGLINGRELDDVEATAFESFLKQLGAGVYRTLDAPLDGQEYQLVQLGEDVPDCERLLAFRPTQGRFLWETPAESRRIIFTETSLSGFIAEELSYREVRDIRMGATPNFIYWQAGRLLGLGQLRDAIWSDVVAALAGLQRRGFSNQGIHDILFHHEVWRASNDIETDLPRELVWRMYGLGAIIEAGFRQ